MKKIEQVDKVLQQTLALLYQIEEKANRKIEELEQKVERLEDFIGDNLWDGNYLEDTIKETVHANFSVRSTLDRHD